MEISGYSTHEIVQRGEEIYARDIKPVVERDHKGEFVVVDIESGDYEVDRFNLPAIERILERHPDAVIHTLRVGFPAAYRFGLRLTTMQ